MQGRRSHKKSEGAQGGNFFSCNFLLLFWAIWKNDLFSKYQKVGGLKPRPLCPPCTPPLVLKVGDWQTDTLNARVDSGLNFIS